MKRFEGKVAFVTGGASGIGAATAQRFADEGAAVVVVDVNEEGAKKLAAGFPKGLALKVDTSDPAAVERALSESVERFGRVDIIFNNAGISGEQVPLEQSSTENWKRVTSVNGEGVFNVLKFGIQSMLKSGGGSIINTSSTNGLIGMPNQSPYTYTKWGVIGLTKAAAIENAKRGIRVNAVAPTVIRTPLLEAYIQAAPNPDELRKQTESFNPMPGLPEPKDIAAAVTFLASDDARFITGHVLTVDGGYTAQ